MRCGPPARRPLTHTRAQLGRNAGVRTRVVLACDPVSGGVQIFGAILLEIFRYLSFQRLILPFSRTAPRLLQTICGEEQL